eukprot:gene14508-19516_t
MALGAYADSGSFDVAGARERRQADEVSGTWTIAVPSARPGTDVTWKGLASTSFSLVYDQNIPDSDVLCGTKAKQCRYRDGKMQYVKASTGECVFALHCDTRGTAIEASHTPWSRANTHLASHLRDVPPAMCSVQGIAVKDGGWENIATLPAGCRPNKRLIFNLNQDANTHRIDVLTDGTVEWIAGTKTQTWISLTGITFAPDADNQQPLALENGWKTYGEDYGPPTVTLGDTCSVQGLVKDGGWGLIATLPAGCRPHKELVFNLNHGANTHRVDVNENGQVLWRKGTKTGTWISLTGITFVPDHNQIALSNGWQAYEKEYGVPTEEL